MGRIRLGVNIDHIATLREVRKSAYPNLIEAANLCKKAGADQITIHLREDRRHIQDSDLQNLLKWRKLPINLEMAFTPEMVAIASRSKPHSITLVPERRQEMTTESGLNLRRLLLKKNILKKLSSKMKVYGFIDPSKEQVQLAKELGMDGVEFHTGTFAHAYDKRMKNLVSRKEFLVEVERLNIAANIAASLNLEVKAGHGLTTENVRYLFKMKDLNELNIGHFLVARAVFVGLEESLIEMIQVLKKAR